MIFVLETEGGLLHLFSDDDGVGSPLEELDAENRKYEFCDQAGQRFVAELIDPVGLFRGGVFVLMPVGEPDPSILVSILSRARSLARRCGSMTTLDDVRRAYVA